MKDIANKLEEIKDSVYELEGLLELARLRGDKTEELIPLMKGKLDEINRFFSEVTSVENVSQSLPDQEYDEPAWSASEPIEELENATEEDVEEGPEEVAAEEMAAAAEFEEEEHASESPEEESFSENPIEENMFAINEKRKGNDEMPKPAFCINDRFRFRRELFGGSDADFSAAMDLVATMENYEEAEQYFTEELGWDVEDPDVADFLAIIERYFER